MTRATLALIGCALATTGWFAGRTFQPDERRAVLVDPVDHLVQNPLPGRPVVVEGRRHGPTVAAPIASLPVPQIWTYEHTAAGGTMPSRAFVWMQGHFYKDFTDSKIEPI